MKKVLLSPVFIELHKQISKGRFKTNTGINFTKHKFYIGRTTVNIFADPFKREVTYTLFEGDGFWDPDFIDEKYYQGHRLCQMGKVQIWKEGEFHMIIIQQ
ncbi:hypothetical protein [Sphingobacterium athyrii]|uniref:Uncharacterized protein n=1 Tax=Sphingobacterium athyrii TaxID=2152717 RepID=A0A363NJX4_9SPHI|nr:hypothetical protein [Sphingobacterium athyrii]PUV21084.1 hypothetical protein DCO56_28905 [Sphingobacterium athyrii]